VAIRHVYKSSEKRAFVLLRSVGLGPANEVVVTVSWRGTIATIPRVGSYMLGPGDERRVYFDLPEGVDSVDSVEVKYEDVLGNQWKNTVIDRNVRILPKKTPDS
jgi:hypothetical protein